MTDLLSDVQAPSDAELISSVRGGDVAAYGQLFTRHRDAANRLARQLVRGPDSDDLVSEAFAKVLTVLQGGGGPDVAFRAYLLTAVRRLHVDRVRAGQRVQTTDDLTPFDPGVPFQDTAVAGFESGAAAKAFASLPERWQLVLWHLEVEGQKPADIAPLLGMSANSVSALAYRAREGLRQAFLTMHISDLTETDCRWVNEHLGAFIRKGLSKRDSGKVQGHLDECRRCTAMYLELTEVNDNLAGIIAPLLLGGAAAGYLASAGIGSAGLLGLFSRVKDLVAANTGATSAAGVTVGVAAAAVAVFTLGGGPGAKPDVRADVPAGVSSAASPGASAPAELAPSTIPSPAASPTTVAPTTTLSPAVAALAAPTAGLPTGSTPDAVTGTPSESVSEPVESPGETLTETPSGAPTESPVESPTESPTEGPTEGPTTPVPGDVDVSLAGTRVDDDGVHLQAVGSPLPPTVTVLLDSASQGVGFAPGDCALAPGGREATCDLTSGGAGARIPATAVQAAAGTYTAFLPFNSLADEPDVDIDVDFVVPAGFRVADLSSVTTRFRHVQSHDVDVALSVVPDTAVRPQRGDLYLVPATVSVTGTAKNRVSDITYTVTGGSFVADDGSLSRVTTQPKEAALSFLVAPDDPVSPNVTIQATVPDPLVDVTETVAVPLSPYDVRLTGLEPLTPTANGEGIQQFTATVDKDGFPDDLVYSLSGGVLDIVSVEDDSVTFTVQSGATDAHDITLKAVLPDGFTDAHIEDNTLSAPWTPQVPSPPSTDLRLTPLTPVGPKPDEDGRYHLHTTLKVFGDRPPTVTLRIDVGADVKFDSVDGCVVAADRRQAVCETPRRVMHLHLVLTAPTDRRTYVSITASAPPPFIEQDETDNSRSATLQEAAAVRYVHVALSVPATVLRPGVDDRYAVPVMVRLSGPAAAQASRITYTVEGGFFVATDGSPRRMTTRPADEATPLFSVRPTDPRAPVVTISGSVRPLHDTNSDTDTVDLPLQRYNVSLGDLTATTEHADEDGDQRFSAPFESEGLRGVTFELADGPAGTRLIQQSAAGGYAKFTIHSDSDSTQPLAIRAVLPDGYTDADPDNNIAEGTFVPRPRAADLALAADFRAYDDYRHGVIAVTVRNAPAGVLKFAIEAHPSVRLTGSADPTDCDTYRQSARCKVSHAGTFTTSFGIDVPPGQIDKMSMNVTAVGYADPDESNNTVRFTRP